MKWRMPPRRRRSGRSGTCPCSTSAGPAPKRIASSISSTVATPSLHEPQRLAPQRLEQAVGDEAVDLLSHDERLHPDAAVDRGARSTVSGASPAAAELDERQQVDRVERMADDEPLRMLHLRLRSAEGSSPEVDDAITTSAGAPGSPRRAARA